MADISDSAAQTSVPCMSVTNTQDKQVLVNTRKFWVEVVEGVTRDARSTWSLTLYTINHACYVLYLAHTPRHLRTRLKNERPSADTMIRCRNQYLRTKSSCELSLNYLRLTLVFACRRYNLDQFCSPGRRKKRAVNRVYQMSPMPQCTGGDWIDDVISISASSFHSW